MTTLIQPPSELRYISMEVLLMFRYSLFLIIQLLIIKLLLFIEVHLSLLCVSVVKTILERTVIRRHIDASELFDMLCLFFTLLLTLVEVYILVGSSAEYLVFDLFWWWSFLVWFHYYFYQFKYNPTKQYSKFIQSIYNTHLINL